MTNRSASVGDATGSLPAIISECLAKDSTDAQSEMKARLSSTISAEADLGRAWHSRITPATATADLLAATQFAKANYGPLVAGIGFDFVGRRVIEIPAGDYTITEAFGLLGRENMTKKISGLKFLGAGAGITRVIFDPTDPEHNVLAKNDFWLGLVFEGISFLTKKAGAVFMESHTTHNAQRYSFTDCEWVGPWKWVFDLQGDNNNSEFLFVGCATTFMQNDGAFLYIGPANTSDQFLNYWFYGFKHWSTSAAIIDASKGGHFHGWGVDVSDWGASSTPDDQAYLFKLRGASHSYGVQSFSMNALRVEAKSNNAALLYSEWGSGNVNMEVDWSSQVGYYTYGDVINIDLGNLAGPVYNFHDSYLAGGIKVRYGVNTWQQPHAIRVTNTTWAQRLTPSEVVSYDRSAAEGNCVDPRVEFIGCRGVKSDARSLTGAPVWDAVTSYNLGDPAHLMVKRVLHLQDIYGNVAEALAPDGIRASLPVGALITAITAFAPVGDVSEGDGAAWTLLTTERTPATIGTVTVSGARSAGYNVRTDLPVPYLCSTRGKATVVLKSNGADQSGKFSMVTIEGYW